MVELLSTETPAQWCPSDSFVGSGSTLDNLLSSSSVICMTLRDIGSASGLPFLGHAGAVALSIVSLVQNARVNRESFKELIQDIAGLISAIVVDCRESLRTGEPVSQRLEGLIQPLVLNLQEIEEFARQRLDRSGLSRILNSSRDKERIARYRGMLRQSLDIFGIRSSFSTQQALDKALKLLEQQQHDFHAERLRQEEEEERRRIEKLYNKELKHRKEEETELKRLQQEKQREEEDERRSAKMRVEEKKLRTEQIEKDAQLALDLCREERNLQLAVELDELRAKEREHLKSRAERQKRVAERAGTRLRELESHSDGEAYELRGQRKRDKQRQGADDRRSRSQIRGSDTLTASYEPISPGYLHPYLPIVPTASLTPPSYPLSHNNYSPSYGNMSFSNISGSSINIVSPPIAPPTFVNGWNSGNITNTSIVNSFNKF